MAQAARDYTEEELSALGTPSTLLTEHMKAHPGPSKFGSDAPSTDINSIRANRIAHLETRRPQYPISGPIPDIVSEKDVFVDYPAANSKIQVRVYSATHPSDSVKYSGAPVILLMHEGGFMLGDISDEEHNARLFVSSFDCVVLNIEYMLAPENPFPVGVKSCYHILETLCSSPKTFHPLANPSLGVIVGGSSAGGNIAAVLAHHARQNKLTPPVTGAWLGVPFIAPPQLVPEKYRSLFNSHSLHVDPVLDGGEDDATLKELYAAIQISDFNDPLFTPFASALYPPNAKNNGSSLPPLARTFIQAGGLDPLRDHAIVYAKALEEDWHAEVKMHMYGGYGHMFWTNWPLLEESKTFWKDTVKGFEWMLGQEAKRQW